MGENARRERVRVESKDKKGRDRERDKQGKKGGVEGDIERKGDKKAGWKASDGGGKREGIKEG